MNIEYFREFIEVANSLSFTTAAHKISISQPALSKHIAFLEKGFGMKLFDRKKNGLQLTEAGRSLFESAEKIVHSYDEAKVNIEKLRQRSPIHVVGHLSDTDLATLAPMVAMLLRDKYDIATVFDRSEISDPFETLENDDVDLFLGYADPEIVKKHGYLYNSFIATRLIAILRNDHPLSEKQSLSWEDLRNETLVKFISPETNPAWKQIETLCLKHGFTPKTRAVSSLNDVEFFSTPLKNDILIWKKTQKQIGLILETGQRAAVSLDDPDAQIIIYAVYKPEKEKRLEEFFKATEEAQDLINRRKHKPLN